MKVKFRHKFIFWFLYPPFKIFFRLKYGFTCKRFTDIEPPFLVLANHSSMIDALMTSLSFRGKPVFYIASDFIFDKTIKSKLMHYLVNPISITHGQIDLKTIREIVSVIKQKGIVGLYPSGSTTYSGNECYIDKSIVKLAALVNAPVLLYRTDGMFGVNPRWGKKVRKGKAYGAVRKVLMPEDIKNKTGDEIYKDILFHLSPEQTELCLSNYNSSARAEYLERVLFVCPNCRRENNLYTKKHTVYCSNCGYSAIYQPDLKFSVPRPAKDKIETIKDWLDFQIKHIQSKNFEAINDDAILCEDKGEIFLNKPKLQNKQIIAKDVSVKLYKNRLAVGENSYKIDDITSLDMQNQNMLLLTINNGRYILKGSKTTNHYKYLLYICRLNKNLYSRMEKQQ